MKTILILMTVFAMLGSPQFVDRSAAQDSSAVAKIVFLQDISAVSNDELASALEQLRERTKRLESELKRPPATLPGSAMKMPAEAKMDMEDNAVNQDDSNKMEEIRRNIELLRKIFKEKQRRKMEAKIQSQSEQSMMEDGSQTKSVSSGKVLKHFADQTMQKADSDLADSADAMESPLPPFKVPKKVVSRIVDAFELGNSLFLAGNLQEAIKYYELVPANRLSAFDRNWLELMIACSYRGQGDYESAELSYRTVANDPNGLYASESAKAWLKYVATRKRLTGLVDEYGSKADTALQNAQTLLEKFENGKSN